MEAVNKERDDCACLSSNPARLAFWGRWFGALGVVVSCVHVCKYVCLSVCLYEVLRHSRRWRFASRSKTRKSKDRTKACLDGDDEVI